MDFHGLLAHNQGVAESGNVVPWWAWLVVGGVLLALELTFIDAAFYLAFLGAAAVLVGIIEVGGAELPLWGQWLLYAVLAVVTMVLFRKRLYDKMRGELPGYDATPVGAEVTVKEAVPAGGQTRVRLRGSQWTATNAGAAIDAGARVRVVEVSGTELIIDAARGSEPQTEQ